MATVYKEIEIGRSKEFVWDAIRDVGAVHKRLVRGFVVELYPRGRCADRDIQQRYGCARTHRCR